MKGQMKVLAIATMLAATGSANAAIDNAGTGNGELFFTIFDKTAQVAYTKDIGIKMSDFLVGTANATSNQHFSLAGDTNWSTFLAQADEANSYWMIGAMDSTGTTVAGGSRYLSTSNNAIANLKNNTNSSLNTFNTTNDFLLSVNSKGTLPTLANGGSAFTTSAEGNSFPVSALVNVETWNGKANGWSSSALATDSLGFFFLTTSNTVGLNKVTVNEYMMTDLSGGAKWSVNLAGDSLDYTATPTPIPAAAWLLGSALLGLVGVGRRQSKANLIAA